MTHSSMTGLRPGDHVRTSEDSAFPLADCVVLAVSDLPDVDAPRVARVRFPNGAETELFTDALTLMARPVRTRRGVNSALTV